MCAYLELTSAREALRSNQELRPQQVQDVAINLQFERDGDIPSSEHTIVMKPEIEAAGHIGDIYIADTLTGRVRAARPLDVPVGR